ncbi:MAG: glycerophosphodiester phosphodiesterase [Nostocoides sp.]
MRARDFAYFDGPSPVGLAHRGGAEYGPNVGIENTMAAFRAAVDLGFRYLETDVHATRDGELLAFHDTVLDRVTDGQGVIASMPYAAVRDVLVGGREPIPRLTDLLEEFPATRINIDVKAPAAVAPLVRIIKAHKAIDRVCVGSFSETRLRAVRKELGPRLATAAGQVGTGHLRFAPGFTLRWLSTPAPVLQIPETHELKGRTVRLVTPWFVDRVHRLGKHLHVWTIDDRADMERLFDWGVDGIVSDRIDTLAEALAARGAPLS